MDVSFKLMSFYVQMQHLLREMRPYLAERAPQVSKDYEFCIKNKKLCIKNDESRRSGGGVTLCLKTSRAR